MTLGDKFDASLQRVGSGPDGASASLGLGADRADLRQLGSGKHRGQGGKPNGARVGGIRRKEH